MSRSRRPHRLSPLVLAALTLLIVEAFCSRGGWANLPPGGEGCSYVAQGRAGIRDGDIPACLQGGSGCYECAISLTDGPGYKFCTETPGFTGCSDVLEWFPDWWPDPDYTDIGTNAGLPPDTLPPWYWTGDDGSGIDLGGGGGGGGGCGQKCAYEPLPASYAVPPGPHRPYRS
jgi:hypothetical protein